MKDDYFLAVNKRDIKNMHSLEECQSIKHKQIIAMLKAYARLI